MGLAAGLGRSQILRDRVLCVQAVCSKVTGALSWEGGMSSFLCVCVCVCVYVCQRDRQRETERQRQRYGRRGRSHFSSMGLCQDKMRCTGFH